MDKLNHKMLNWVCLMMIWISGLWCLTPLSTIFQLYRGSQFGHHDRNRMVVWLQLPMQSLPITTKIVSLNPAHREVYSLQRYVIKFVSDLWQVSGFLTTHFYIKYIGYIIWKHICTNMYLYYIYTNHW
jgi:hypothetical protein